jgi:hypothetical protein
MHFSSPHLLVALSIFLQLGWGLVTLDTIRNLTAVTDECKERIVQSGSVVVDEMARVLGGIGAGQVVLGGGDEEVEDVSFYFFCFLGNWSWKGREGWVEGWYYVVFLWLSVWNGGGGSRPAAHSWLTRFGEVKESRMGFEFRFSELTIIQTVAAALRMLCSDLLRELEKPLSSSSFPSSLPEVPSPSANRKIRTDTSFRNDAKKSRKSTIHSWLPLSSFCMRFRRDKCFGTGVRRVRFLMLWCGCRGFGLVGMRWALSFLTSASFVLLASRQLWGCLPSGDWILDREELEKQAIVERWI